MGGHGRAWPCCVWTRILERKWVQNAQKVERSEQLNGPSQVQGASRQRQTLADQGGGGGDGAAAGGSTT